MGIKKDAAVPDSWTVTCCVCKRRYMHLSKETRMFRSFAAAELSAAEAGWWVCAVTEVDTTTMLCPDCHKAEAAKNKLRGKLVEVVNLMCDDVHANAIKHQFYLRGDNGLEHPGGGVPCLLALIHSEVSEALDAHRNRYKEGTNYPEDFAEELADIMLRVADLAGFLQLDLGQTIVKKMKINEARPVLHGGKAY